MALSGNITQHFYSSNGYSLVLEWTGAQSIVNNTTKITAKLYLRSNGSGYSITSSAKKIAKITVDGATSTKSNANVSVTGNQKKLIHTYERTVSHTSSGTKKVKLGGSLEIGIQLSQGYVGTVDLPSTEFTLNTIPRASSISSFPNFTIGNNFTVTISRASTGFTHNLTLKVGSKTIKSVTGVGTSYTFSLTTAEENIIYAAIPNATKATLTLTCQTRSGSSNIGSAVSKTATASVGAGIVPTFTTITHSEYVVDVATLVGAYVQGKSKLSMAITGAAGVKSSTIKSYSITVDGKTYSKQTVISDVITSAGELKITGKVTDSRGRSASKEVTVSVLPYAPPKITAFSLQRCTAAGVLDDLGTYVKVTRAGSISSLKPGSTEKNSLSYVIRSKARTATTWTAKKTGTGALTLTGSDVVGTYTAVTSADFRLDITDIFNTSISLAVLTTAAVTLSWGPEGVGIGKIVEPGRALDVAGPGYIDGHRIVYFGSYEDW